jgi:MOSC domain-containing protein YiiM
MSSQRIKLVGLQLATPIIYVEEDQSTWTSSLEKKPVCHDVYLRHDHLAGNEQADLRHHGGEDKTLYTMPMEHICHWRTVFSRPDLPFGGLGENLTVLGALETDVCIGDRFQLGEAMIQISQPRLPCWKIGRLWGVLDFGVQMEAEGRCGWYSRTIQEGTFSLADDLVLLERVQPEWSVARVFKIITHPFEDLQSSKALLDVPEAAKAMKDSLASMLKNGIYPDQTHRFYGDY